MDYEKKYKEALEEAAEEYAYTNWEDNDYHEGASEGLPFDDEQFRRGYEAGKHDAMREQKPVEWSEDFDKEVENIHKRYPEVSFAKLTRIAYHFSKWANRYKDTEWSEVDEEMLEYIIGDVNDATQLYTTRAAKDMADKEIAWLKSLRPSWKPSEKPNIELIQRSWYMEGYNDCKFEKEPVWIISTGPDGPQYKLNPNREGGRG